MKYLSMAVIAVFMSIVALSSAEAKRHHGGSCDGIHRCRCGSTQAAHFGFPRIFHGHNLWLASEWPRAFPRTTAHSEAVGYQPGHVFRYDHETRPGYAIVHDDAGTYERRVRGAIYVDPSGNRVTYADKSNDRIAAH
jgi:hypothetical protein